LTRLRSQAPLRGGTPRFEGDVVPDMVPEKYRLGRAFVPGISIPNSSISSCAVLEALTDRKLS
jgi:hypothetical protein